jgi:hypothetical protein
MANKFVNVNEVVANSLKILKRMDSSYMWLCGRTAVIYDV